MQSAPRNVVVVGGGWTGAVVARRLGPSVPLLVLEGGARAPRRLPRSWSRFERATEPLTRVDEDVWAHDISGASFPWLRVRATGGRTLLWGAWMDRPGERSRLQPWSSEKLTAMVRRAERWLGVQSARGIEERVRALAGRGLHLEPKRACVHPLGERPLTALDLLHGTRVRSGTAVLRVLHQHDRVRGVEAIDIATRRIFTVDAQAVVLAASPFETIRILRESGVEGTGLGEGWSDHLVSGSMVVVGAGPAQRQAAGPLEGAALIRMPGKRGSLGSCIEVRGPTPLDSLDTESLRTLGVTTSEARRLAYFAVFALGELAARSERRLALQPRKLDALGRPRLRLVVPALSTDERELAKSMDTICAEICEQLGGRGARTVRIRSARRQGESGHEVGGCPTARRGRGVVDEDGAVYGLRGLYVADGSRMGRALDVHPSLTLAALAFDTADRVKRDLR